MPHGVPREGAWRRDAVLRAPVGADEAHLAETLGAASAAERANALLAACVVRLAGERPGLEDIRALTAGDREALLLQLRAAAFGDRVLCTLACPACEELLDLPVAVHDLLVDAYDDVAAEYEVAGARLRLPTGGDLEAAGAAADADAGAKLLLGRCVRGGDPGPGAVEEALARLDPQADVRLSSACPACGERVDAILDAGTLVLDELAADVDELLAEVHALARHYHWSEAEILALELPRRRRYLELLVADEVAEVAAG